MASNTYVAYSHGGEAYSQEGEVNQSNLQPVNASDMGEAAPQAGDDRAYHAEMNRDPLRRRIVIPRRGLLYILQKLWKKYEAWLQPEELSKEELTAREEKARLKKLEKVLKDEAKDAAMILSHSLARMGFCYKRLTAEGEIKVKRYVTFDVVSLQEDAIWFHIDMRHLPYSVTKNDLIKQDVIDDLSVSVGRRVGVRHEAETGVWYIIERASGRMGIPSHVKLSEMWERMPQTATGLTVPIGMTNNRKLVYESIADFPHALVAGTTGGGKSNMLNVILCTLIRQNTPEKLQLVLVDLKAGLEFSFYEGIPHLLPIPEIAEKGIVYDREHVLPMLSWVIGEGRRRMGIIGASGHKDISKYNAHHRKAALPRMLVVIDEWADVRLSAHGKETEELLANAVQLLRAAGIHFIVCTQVPSKEVLSMRIRTNLPTKLAFNCPDMAASLSILGNTDAFGVGDAGRGVYRCRHQMIVQTPFISDETVRETVKAAREGQAVAISTKHDVTIQQIVEWGLQENQAILDNREVYKHFRERGITDMEIRSLLSGAEGKEFLIGAAMYRVEPGAGRRPRRLVASQEDEVKQ